MLDGKLGSCAGHGTVGKELRAAFAAPWCQCDRRVCLPVLLVEVINVGHSGTVFDFESNCAGEISARATTAAAGEIRIRILRRAGTSSACGRVW